MFLMAMPKWWRDTESLNSSTSIMPEISLLSRPAVEADSLKIKGYKLKTAVQKNVSTGADLSLPA